MDDATLVLQFIARRHMQPIREGISDALGMSYEVNNCTVENLRAEIWKLTKVTFTGAAVLLRNKAAYRDTTFVICRVA